MVKLSTDNTELGGNSEVQEIPENDGNDELSENQL